MCVVTRVRFGAGKGIRCREGRGRDEGALIKGLVVAHTSLICCCLVVYGGDV